MLKDDSVYARHMLDLAQSIATKVEGKTRADFDADENLRLAITHLIQTIGEAARRVSESYRHRHPEIPWYQIIGMRHRVVHDYMDVDFDIVWDVATVELPKLIPSLQAIAAEANS